MAKKIKKDFDKDKMYRKIMPSSLQTQEPALAPLADKVDPEKPSEPVLHNFMEDMVREKLEHTMKVLDVCDCDRCRKDIVALALNQLPTAYAVVTGKDDHYLRKLRGNYEVKVTASLIKAIQQVKQSPRH